MRATWQRLDSLNRHLIHQRTLRQRARARGGDGGPAPPLRAIPAPYPPAWLRAGVPPHEQPGRPPQRAQAPEHRRLDAGEPSRGVLARRPLPPVPCLGRHGPVREDHVRGWSYWAGDLVFRRRPAGAVGGYGAGLQTARDVAARDRVRRGAVQLEDGHGGARAVRQPAGPPPPAGLAPGVPILSAFTSFSNSVARPCTHGDGLQECVKASIRVAGAARDDVPAEIPARGLRRSPASIGKATALGGAPATAGPPARGAPPGARPHYRGRAEGQHRPQVQHAVRVHVGPPQRCPRGVHRRVSHLRCLPSSARALDRRHPRGPAEAGEAHGAIAPDPPTPLPPPPTPLALAPAPLAIWPSIVYVRALG